MMEERFINLEDGSIDIVRALQKGLAKLQRIGIARQHLGRLKNSLSAVKPSLPQVVSGQLLPTKPRVYYRQPAVHESSRDKARRVKRELLDAGVTLYGLLKSESRYLPKILHDNEHIEAVIYGQHSSSSAMLIATDQRIIYLDKKPMTELFDEVSYEVVSGIAFDIHTFFATVILHTPVRNYDFRFVNLHCAEKFARHIEKQRLEREQKEEKPTIELLYPSDESIQNYSKYPSELKKHMAGYYWLPIEEEEHL